jgi:redox-sensitive bicupin YhaK (pirin superfamily)
MSNGEKLTQPRKIVRRVQPQPVVEGAGVLLKRSIATRELDYVDPFLLFDHFGSENPDDYIAGFPMHPHRGIETVTYMLSGVVNHKDSLGNAGSIGSGDIQWMTAGRGILHEEMPAVVDEKMEGFQLWVNLPAKLKMTRPRYQDILESQVPEVETQDGAKVRIIAGQVEGTDGPVTDIFADPTYLDVTVPPQGSFTRSVTRGHTVFAYVFEGKGEFGVTPQAGGVVSGHPHLLIFGDGDHLVVHTQDHHVRFLLVSGQPLNEPIARYGPFVMNTREEIMQTLQELREGVFPPSPD